MKSIAFCVLALRLLYLEAVLRRIPPAHDEWLRTWKEVRALRARLYPQDHGVRL